MWYPEEPVTYCEYCDLDIPADCCWRGRGRIVGGDGTNTRAALLHSLCPGCGRQYTTGLQGSLPYRLFYNWLWRLRYPRTRPPAIAPPGEMPRRAAG